jgi:hypothetical protein
VRLRRFLAWLLLITGSNTIVFAFAMKVLSRDWWTVVLAYVGIAIVAAAQLAASLLFFLEADALA